MSVSRALPLNRVDPPEQTRSAPPRRATAYDFDVVADLPPEAEPDVPAPEPTKHR